MVWRQEAGSAACVSSVLVTNSIGVLRCRCERRGGESGRLAAPVTAEETAVLALLDALEDEFGLLLRHAAIAALGAEPFPCVPEPNLADCVVELTCIGGSADPRRLLASHPTGLEQLVDPSKGPLGFHRLSRIVTALIHKGTLSRQHVVHKSACRPGYIVSDPQFVGGVGSVSLS